MILFQAASMMVLLSLVGIAFNYLYQNITQTLIANITDSLSHAKAIDGKEILDSLDQIKKHNFSVILIFTTITTIVFGYGISIITFTPARNALTSQKRFVSDIAHELRTPLSIIKTNTEVVLLSSTVNTEIRKTLKSNLEELDRASEIINNLLSLSSFTNNERINFASTHMGNVIDGAVRKVIKLAESKNLQLITRKKEPSFVWGNHTALEQVVINLLRNSIAYTSSGGRIIVGLDYDYQGSIVLTVQDNGVGISQKDLFHIFEPFYRAERSRNRNSGSSGLGLTIVSELIKLHNGKISIRSALGKGTIATVTLPPDKRAMSKDDSDEQNQISIDFLSKQR